MRRRLQLAVALFARCALLAGRETAHRALHAAVEFRDPRLPVVLVVVSRALLAATGLVHRLLLAVLVVELRALLAATGLVHRPLLAVTGSRCVGLVVALGVFAAERHCVLVGRRYWLPVALL